MPGFKTPGEVGGGTLGTDTSGTGVGGSGAGASASYYQLQQNISPSGNLDIATTTPTFAADSLAVGVAVLAVTQSYSNAVKLQVVMGGVKAAESAYIGTDHTVTSVVGFRALSGAQSVICRLHNYGAGTYGMKFHSSASTVKVTGGVGTGSVKIS